MIYLQTKYSNYNPTFPFYKEFFLFSLHSLLANPTLSSGFLSSCFLPDKLSQINSLPKEENLRHILGKIYEDKPKNRSLNYHGLALYSAFIMSSIVLRKWFGRFSIGFLPTLDDAISFVTSLPEEVDIREIRTILRKYPAFTGKITDLFLDKLRNGFIDDAFLLADFFIENILDIFIILNLQDNFYEFLSNLLNSLENFKPKEGFEKLWILFIYLTFDPWFHIGSKIALESFLNWSKSVSKSISIFINCFLTNQIDSSCRNTNVNYYNIEQLSPLSMCIELLFLLHDSPDVDSAISLAQKHSFLWPTVFFWLFFDTPISGVKVLSAKFPNEKIYNSLFSYISVIYMKSSRKWKVLIDEPCYMLNMRYPPPSLDLVNSKLLEDIHFMAQPNTAYNGQTRRIFVCWKALFNHFGVEKFTTTLLRLMIFDNIYRFHPKRLSFDYQFAACVFIFLCENDPEKIYGIIKCVKEIMNIPELMAKDGSDLAVFSLVLVTTMGKQREKAFSDLLQFRQSLLDENPTINSAKMAFCNHLIKFTIYIPYFRDMISPDMFKDLLIQCDWQTVIDFFIVKSRTEKPSGIIC